MPVHVYGYPCNTESLQKIAEVYGLKLIYDAAHAFGLKINGDSVLKNGDLSILSFHATKVFNTIEGGAIVSPDEKTKRRIDYLKNFGFANEITVIEPGINAKMNEVQAVYGLVQLRYIDECIAKRKFVTELYRTQLQDIPGISFTSDIHGVHHNYSYFPVFVDTSTYGKTRDELYEILRQHNIFGRRYFYPLISQFPTYRGLPSARKENLPVATKVAEQVICLPIYPDLKEVEVSEVCRIIRQKSKLNHERFIL
jgi:dTDP-4-amino-4,6-dideoxygalactose transaminase